MYHSIHTCKPSRHVAASSGFLNLKSLALSFVEYITALERTQATMSFVQFYNMWNCFDSRPACFHCHKIR